MNAMEFHMDKIVANLEIAKLSISEFTIWSWVLLAVSIFFLRSNLKGLFSSFSASTDEMKYNIQYYEENKNVSVWIGVFISLAISIGYLALIRVNDLLPMNIMYGVFVVLFIDLIFEHTVTTKAVKYGRKIWAYSKFCHVVNLTVIVWALKELFIH